MTPMLGIMASAATGSKQSSYESIATATGTGASSTITFSSIPATFKHLQIRAIVRSTEAGSGTNFVMQLNADTATNYSHHNLNGSGTTATSGGSATVASMDIGRAPGAGTTAGTMNATIIDIIDYASTTKYKTVRTFTGQDSNNTYAGSVTLRSGSWRSTSAITSISLILDNPFFSTLTTFALYGIKGA